jgi:hypothetical protein
MLAVNGTTVLLATLATVVVLFGCEVVLASSAASPAGSHGPRRARCTGEEWFTAVSQQKGSESLAVQTLRNSLISATMTASTAVLGLMCTVTLAAPSLHASFGEAAVPPGVTPRLVL